jgi:hypothetical protein
MRIVAFVALALIFFPVLGAALGMALGAILNVLRRNIERSADIGTSRDRLASAEKTSRPQPHEISLDQTQQRIVLLGPATVSARRSRSVSTTSATQSAAMPTIRRNVGSARRHSVAQPASMMSAHREAVNSADHQGGSDMVL